MSGERVLVVDDNRANSKLARVVLESAGYRVRVADDATEALTLVDEFSPALILMDLQLPGVDGLELTRRLKAQPRTRHIVVVALTAYAMKGDEERAREAGCDGYIAKPIDTRALAATVAAHLPPATPNAAPGPPPDSSRAATILVVEDNPITRRLVRYALECEGYGVAEAGDGATALALLRELQPDLVLQDLGLPDMDGLALVAAIRERPEGERIPVLLLTGRTAKLEQLRTRGEGFDDFLTKPMEPSRLVAAIARHLGGAAPPPRPSGGARGRVLAVDDEPLNLKLAEVRLRHAGFAVRTAASGGEALELARQEPPAAILADVLMPLMDGFQLARAVREDPQLADVPVVLISSAFAGRDDRDLARRMGASALVERTSDLREAADALDDVIANRRSPAAEAPSPALERAYVERLSEQLDAERRANRALTQRGALSAATLSVLSAITDAFAQPLEPARVLGTVLVHCLDATGLSTGLLYVDEPGSGLELRASCGLPPGSADAAARGFGAFARLRRLIAAGEPVAFEADASDPEIEALLSGLDHSSVLVVPLTALGEQRGALVLGSDSDVLSEASWLTFSRALSAQLGQAIVLGQMIGQLAGSELRYRSLFERASEGIFQATREGRYLTANPATARILGYASPEELIAGVQDIGQDLYVDPGERQAMLRRLEEEGTVNGFETRLRRKDGSVAWIRMSATAVYDDAGALVHLEGMVDDITERRQAEAALRAGEERLQRIVATSPAVLYVLRKQDGGYGATWVSANLPLLTGHTAEEALQPGWWSEGLEPSERDEVIARSAQGFADGHLVHEYRFRQRDGSFVWLHDEMRVVRDAAGEPLEAVGSWMDVSERRRAEEALRASEERYRALFKATPIAMWVYDPRDLQIVAANEAAVRQYGYSRDELLTMTLRDVRPAEDVRRLERSAPPFGAPQRHAGVWRHRRKDGSELLVDIHTADVVLGGREVRIAVLNDITERRQLEEQLQQAQKMEAVGRLAGGVAHDFNNVLTVIMYCTELLREGLEIGDSAKRRRAVDEIAKASERAVGLTRQLLAFSRKQVVATRVVDLNQVVTGTNSLLRRLIGEDVELVEDLAPRLRPVRVDVGQMEQVLMNLAVNARDAMPRGGRLTISTRNLDLDEHAAAELGSVSPGEHVLLAVTDTGTGIDEATKLHLFEPFFTTKEQGKGTGLGLATVYGIVQQSGGAVRVESEPGAGARFEVVLPRSPAPIDPSGERTLHRGVSSGSETVLLVEDEEGVREIAAECLRLAGYTVLEAARPSIALELAERHPGRIDVLLTDVVMPEMQGPELAAELRRRRPEVRVLFMSGYVRDDLAAALREADAAMLQKPFRAAELTRKLREVLEQPGR